MEIELTRGKLAPDFTLPTAEVGKGNSEITLSSLRGNMVVLFFYPKDMTPGCTTEAIAFSSLKKDFDTLGVKIIGISKDSVARHDKFITKHDLNMILAADEDGEVCEAYGIWVLKKLYGREYMGIERSTFLIDADGKIVQIWRKVRVKNHAEAVLEAAQGTQ
ncbi:MAG: thioredoxin-dependent thiol peroxidase [Robiginitomaculum sp.]|nr:thioredoxin-dependent thiol peroxidase [Robiginitomaculum sp.]